MSFDSILPTVELCRFSSNFLYSRKLKLIFPNPALLYQLNLYYIFSTLFHFNILHSIFTRSQSIPRNHFLCSFIKSNSSSITVLSWDWSNSVTSLGTTSNSSFLAVYTASAVTPSTEVLERLKVMRVGGNIFQPAVNVDNLSSFCEPLLFLITSTMVNPFQVFNRLYPDPSEESLQLYEIYFLNN